MKQMPKKPYDVEAARAICDAATPGPWGFLKNDFMCGYSPHICQLAPDGAVSGKFIGTIGPAGKHKPHAADSNIYKNARMIVAARTLLPEALDEIERLRDELTKK